MVQKATPSGWCAQGDHETSHDHQHGHNEHEHRNAEFSLKREGKLIGL